VSPSNIFHAFPSLFKNHSLAKLCVFPSNLIKKFLTAIKVLPITTSSMLLTKTCHKSLMTFVWRRDGKNRQWTRHNREEKEEGRKRGGRKGRRAGALLAQQPH
jgi:hypothetical protein